MNENQKRIEELERKVEELEKRNSSLVDFDKAVMGLAHSDISNQAVLRECVMFFNEARDMIHQYAIPYSAFSNVLEQYVFLEKNIDPGAGLYSMLDYISNEDGGGFRGLSKDAIFLQILREWSEYTGRTDPDVLFAQDRREEQHELFSEPKTIEPQIEREACYSRSDLESFIRYFEEMNLGSIGSSLLSSNFPSSPELALEITGDFSFYATIRDGEKHEDFSPKKFALSVKELLQRIDRLESVGSFAHELEEPLFSGD